MLPAPQLLCPGGGKEPFFGRGVVAPSVPPADGHPCLCLWLRGAVGLLPPGGLSLHRTRFLFVAGLSPGPALPPAGDGWQGASGSVERWGCSGSLLQLQCLSVGRGWGFLSRHREQLRSGSGQPPIPEEMPPHTGMEPGCSSRTEHPEEAVGSPSLCFALYSLFFGVQTEARLLGLWLPGSGTCSFVSRDAGDPPMCWSSDAFAGVRAVPCRQSQVLCHPGPPKPPLCWWPPEKCLFLLLKHKDSKDCSAGLLGRGTWGSPGCAALPPHECLWFLRDLN